MVIIRRACCGLWCQDLSNQSVPGPHCCSVKMVLWCWSVSGWVRTWPVAIGHGHRGRLSEHCHRPHRQLAGAPLLSAIQSVTVTSSQLVQYSVLKAHRVVFGQVWCLYYSGGSRSVKQKYTWISGFCLRVNEGIIGCLRQHKSKEGGEGTCHGDKLQSRKIPRSTRVIVEW